MTNEKFVKDGKVTADGFAELKKSYPFTDYSELEKDPVVTKLIDTFTVGSLAGYLGGRLEAENIKV